MRFPRFSLFPVFFALIAHFAAAQQTAPAVQRDPQALAILEKSVAAMANVAPTDSSATGTITVVEGSSTQTGSIQILTRGTAQTAETLTLPQGQRAVIYSNGDAKEVTGTQSTKPPLELILTDQCPDFPLPFLSSVLNNADEALLYVGLETLNGASVQHIQVWNSFAWDPSLQELAPFSREDIWFDATSGLPLKLAYSRRAGRGAVPAIPVEVLFSNYTNVGGVLYPFQIKKSYNGTPWQTITITKVSFNTGLTDADFPVAQGGAL
jgi:hypothetical protein